MCFSFKKYFSFGLVLISIVFLTGSISAYASAISMETGKKIKDTKVYHVINQDEISVSVGRNGVAGSVASSGGGFVLTMLTSLLESSMYVNSKQAANSSDKLKPIKEKLAAIDFRKLFNERLSSEITNELQAKNYFDIKDVFHSNEDKVSLLKKVYKPGSGTILILETRYFFTEYHQIMVVETDIDLILEPPFVESDGASDEGVESEDALDGEDDLKWTSSPYPIYRGKARYQSRVQPPGENILAYWARDKNSLNVLMESLEVLPKLIVRNLLDSINGINSLETDYWKMANERFVPYVLSAQLLESNDERDLTYLKLLGRDVHASVSNQDRYVDEPEEKDEDEF